MSFNGFSPTRTGDNSGQGGNGNTGGDNGIKSAQRDAWGNPIREPKQKTASEVDNDGGIDDETIDNLWTDVQKKPALDANGKPIQQQTTTTTEPVKVDPKTQLTAYLTENGLGELTLSEAEKNELKEGNFDNFNAKVLGLVQQAHIKALSGAQTIIKAEVAKALKEGGEQTRSFIAGKEAVTALNNALPFTKDPSIGPIAQTVMQRLLDRGASQTQAIEGVKRWSEKFVNLADPDRQVNPNRGGNFRGAPSNEGNTNWLEMLSPKG